MGQALERPDDRLPSAILLARVGPSHANRQDDEGAVAALAACRSACSEQIAAHRGRMVDAPEEFILADFQNVADAVKASIEMQKQIEERNTGLPEGQGVEIQIGIDLADRFAGTDAGQRIERLGSLAKPGGICVSGAVLDAVKQDVPLDSELLSEETVEGAAEPVRVYRLIPEATVGTSTEADSIPGSEGFRRKLALLAAVVLFLGAIGVTAWFLFKQLTPAPAEDGANISPVLEGVLAVVGVSLLAGAAIAAWNVYARTTGDRDEHDEQDAQHPLHLPDRPSIAVLPFANMSQDADQEYFSDGITEDIITDLSSLRGLFVIARNSTFVYKGQAVDVRQVGRELGVRYVLEGSVRKAGARVRISAQLAEAVTGNQLWTKRYDREIDDIFSIQDEIAGDIVAELDVKLIEGEQAREWRKTTQHPEAYDYFLRGRAAHLEFTREGNALSKQLLEQAIELDPDFTKAIVQLGWNYGVEAESAWTESSSDSWEHALELANRAIALDDSFGEAHSLLGLIQINHVRDHERGIAELEKSVALNPNSSTSAALLGTYAGLKGAPERAVETVKKAIRLNPFPPSWFFNALGSAHLLARQYDESIAGFTQCIAQTPEFIPARVGLTIAYLELGKRDEARAQAGEVIRINPQFNPENYALAEFDPSLSGRMKTLFAEVS